MSIVLNGSSQYAYVDQSVLTSPPLTLAGWFKPSNITDTGTMVSVDNADPSGYLIAGNVEAAGTAVGDPVRGFPYNGSSYGIAATTAGFSAGVWQHFAAVFNSSSSRDVYLNGGSKGSNTDFITPVGANEFVIGARRRSSLVSLFSGKLAEIAIWNVALNASELASLAAGTNPSLIRPGSLVVHWPLYEDEQESVVNGLSLTTVNSPTFETGDHPSVSQLNRLLTGNGIFIQQLTDIPEPKQQHGFAELNGVLYAVCGLTTGSVHSHTTYAYDIAAGTWSKKADAPDELQSPVLRSVNGKLYLIGGYDSTVPLKVDTVYEYDPVGDTWTTKTPMPTAREDMASAVIDGKIYIFGGLTNPVHTLVNAVEVYDPATDSWSTKANWAAPRALGDFGVSYNGKIYLVSATADMSGYSAELNATKRVDEYDPVSDTYTQKQDMNIARCYKEVVAIEGLLYVVSGVLHTQTDFVYSDEVYDISKNIWKRRPNPTHAAVGIAMASYNGSYYYCGGWKDGDATAKFYKYTPTGLGVTGASGTLSFLVPPASACAYRFFNISTDMGRDG